ncbi:glycosyltransferase family 4 protein [Dermacoccus abyssi]|uniref:glycosyltransferase family 4 protein n=1 Tax=Dermacoccus abyssi TaxID=322596 RepID=UPI0015F97A9A|nr:glycosyltransferase family 4 protein [Dermacoccus abyssi]
MPNANHAGGVYLYEHLSALLGASHTVHVFAPSSSRNRDDLPLVESKFQVSLVGDGEQGSPKWGRLGHLAHRVLPEWLPRRVVREVARDARIVRECESADLVEFQWFESLAFIRMIANLIPDTPRLLVLHDLSSIASARSMTQGLPWNRALAALRFGMTRVRELRLIPLANSVSTLSPKDAALVRLVTPGLRHVTFVDVPLLPPGMPVPNPPSEHEVRDVLFVGAFDRGPNSDAAHWLIDTIMPIVWDEMPSVRLTLAGINPTDRMLVAAEQDQRVAVTGAVESLEPYYQRATVVTVPLRGGAGVKFKTITAMLERRAVIATPVGIEGIAGQDSDLIFAVADDARGIANGILAALRDESARNATADRAYEWATAKYSHEAFSQRLSRIYEAARAVR